MWSLAISWAFKYVQVTLLWISVWTVGKILRIKIYKGMLWDTIQNFFPTYAQKLRKLWNYICKYTLVLPKFEDIHHRLGSRPLRPAQALLLLAPLCPASLHPLTKEQRMKNEDKDYHWEHGQIVPIGWTQPSCLHL